jgi:hypothetical protein
MIIHLNGAEAEGVLFCFVLINFYSFISFLLLLSISTRSRGVHHQRERRRKSKAKVEQREQ